MAHRLKPFRTLLDDLYLAQNLKLEDIRTFMKEQHSINAGRGTYERLFKQWGFKKKNNGSNWEWVSHKIRERQDHGRKSALYIKNRRIPAETVRKEISRHVSTLQQSLDAAGTVPSPRTPHGYAIATPASTAVPGTPYGAPTPDSQADAPDGISQFSAYQNTYDTSTLCATDDDTESHDSDDDEDASNFLDKVPVLETSEGCGPFNQAPDTCVVCRWYSNNTKHYDYVAECIEAAPDATADTLSSKLAPIAARLKIPLSKYRQDVAFLQSFYKMG